MARAEQPIGEFWDHSVVVWDRRPDTPMQALMEHRLDRSLQVSLQELQPVREAVAESMEMLSDQDQYLVNAWFIERITIRSLAARLGLEKSYTHRLVHRAARRLRDRCVQHPTIQVYLGIAGAIPPQSPTAVVVLDECNTA